MGKETQSKSEAAVAAQVVPAELVPGTPLTKAQQAWIARDLKAKAERKAKFAAARRAKSEQLAKARAAQAERDRQARAKKLQKEKDKKATAAEKKVQAAVTSDSPTGRAAARRVRAEAKAVVESLLDRAKDGNTQAAKFLFEFAGVKAGAEGLDEAEAMKDSLIGRIVEKLKIGDPVPELGEDAVA